MTITNDKFIFIDPATFNNNIGQSKTINEFIVRSGTNNISKILIMLFYINNHYIVVEIDRNNITNNVINIDIACSQNNDITYLIQQVKSRHLDLFLDLLFGFDNYNFIKATNVSLQTNVYDCGVLALRRMFVILGLQTRQISLEDQNIDPKLFRLLILSKSLEYKISRVSKFIYNPLQPLLPEANKSTTIPTTDILTIDDSANQQIQTIDEPADIATNPTTATDILTMDDSANQQIQTIDEPADIATNPTTEQQTIDKTADSKNKPSKIT